MRAFITIASILALSACAQGIDPPAATKVRPIRGGTFSLGQDNFDPCANSRVANGVPIIDCAAATQSELVRAEAEVGNFCIDEHEVTVDQYRHCVARGECPKPASTNAGNRGDGFIAKYYGDPDRYGSYPVLGVTWEDANKYCAFREGRLPTEIEWEFVATSRGQRAQVFADASVVSDVTANCTGNRDKIAFGPCSEKNVREVKSSSADVTAESVFDMAGNAQEWTADEFDYLAYCDEDQPGGAKLTDLYVINGERPEPKASSSWPEPLLTGAVDACLDATGDTNNTYDGLCNDQAERCLRVCKDAWDGNDQTSVKQERWQTFDCEARVTKPRGCDCGAPDSDECTAHCACLDDPNEPAASDSGCIAACFDAYSTCATGCTERGVVSTCLKDGNDSRPRPLCKPRSYDAAAAKVGRVTPAALQSDAIKGRHVVRGANFQEVDACDLRPTRRTPKNVSSPLVGFRCVYEPGQGPCR